MATRPPYPIRTLKLTIPRMHGGDVEAVQKRLRGVYTDGEYGPATGAAVKDWKWRVGYHDSQVNTALAPEEHLVLVGFRKRTADMITRTAARKAKGLLAKFKPPKDVNAGTLAAARRWIGVTESPPRSNKVPKLVAWFKSLGVKAYVEMGVAWCEQFAMACGLAAGSTSARAGLVEQKFNALYTVDVVNLAKAGRFGLSIVPLSEVRPGDLAHINFPGGDPLTDHVEVVEIPPVEVGGGEYVTIGGNTSPGDSGSQANGGGVFRRRRFTYQVAAYVRLG